MKQNISSVSSPTPAPAQEPLMCVQNTAEGWSPEESLNQGFSYSAGHMGIFLLCNQP